MQCPTFHKTQQSVAFQRTQYYCAASILNRFAPSPFLLSARISFQEYSDTCAKPACSSFCMCAEIQTLRTFTSHRDSTYIHIETQ